MIALVLWLLASADAGLAGYRAAAGRNALINKRRYYARAVLRGVFVGQVVAGLVGVVIVMLLLRLPEPQLLMDTLEEAAWRMASIYVPYALMIFVALGIRMLPSIDIRCLTSVLVFGPLTFIRPMVITLGVLWGGLAVPGFTALLPGTLILCLMLPLEWLIGKLAGYTMVLET